MYAKIINGTGWLDPRLHKLESMSGKILKKTIPRDNNWYYVGKCYISPLGNTIATVDDGVVEFHLQANSVVFSNNTYTDESLPHKDSVEQLLKSAKVGERCVVVNTDGETITTGIVISKRRGDYYVRCDKTHQDNLYPIELVLSEQSLDPDLRRVDCTVKELLELLHSDKPAEHILLDIEDYITN